MLALCTLVMTVFAFAALFYLARLSKTCRIKAQWIGFRRWNQDGRDYYLDVLELALPGGRRALAGVSAAQRINYAPDGSVASLRVTNRGVSILADPRLYLGLAVYSFLCADTLAAGIVDYHFPPAVIYLEGLACLAALARRGMISAEPDWDALKTRLARQARKMSYAPVERVPFSRRNKERRAVKRRKSTLAGVAFVLLLTFALCVKTGFDMRVVFHPHLSATGHVRSWKVSRGGVCYLTAAYRDKDGREQTAQFNSDLSYPSCRDGAAVDVIYDPHQAFAPALEEHGWNVAGTLLLLLTCLVFDALVIFLY